MGKASRNKNERTTRGVTVTHEPAVPQNWPEGHVSVALTDADQDECLEITIHGVKHYLHSTTARELNNMLIAKIDEWNVTAEAGGAMPV